MLELLLEMMSYRRPHESNTEELFIKTYLDTLGCQADAFGNRWLAVGSQPSVLWSSHTDTVHRQDGRQHVFMKKGKLRTIDANSNCLGADCTTGVWLMSEMIRAGVPGLYVFHRGEEHGGQGSTWIANHNPSFLEGIEHAIAFDRRGRDSVITRQLGRQCASDALARDIAARLAAVGLPGFQPDPTGSFTDTAFYCDLVPECTNISVGYFNQHTKDESQDIGFALRLRDAMVAADWSDLTVERDPGAHDELDWRDYGYGYATFSDPWPKSHRNHLEDYTMADLVAAYPHVAHDMLVEMGVDYQTLLDRVYDEEAAEAGFSRPHLRVVS